MFDRVEHHVVIETVKSCSDHTTTVSILFYSVPLILFYSITYRIMFTMTSPLYVN